MFVAFVLSSLIGCGPKPASLQLAEGAASTVYTLDAIELPQVTALDDKGAPMSPAPDLSWSLQTAELGSLDLASHKLTPSAEGDLITIISAGEVTTTWSVKVIVPDEVSLIGASTGDKLAPGATVQLAGSVKNDGSPLPDLQLTWSSSDEAVATVSAGLVTAVAPGSVTIKAAGGGKEATVDLVVAADEAVADGEAAPE